ncbi:MAG TPA: (Fe-S)-binding protein, partial [bacterium]|nr:(Fe-S)-binding protein [bacterium]
IDKTKAYYCLDCGICTGSCPVSRLDPNYSPRLTVERALVLGEGDVVCDPEIWSCLTCGTCNLRCPSTVDYTAFLREARSRARELGETGLCTHAEKIDAFLDLQLLPTYRRPASWLGRGAKVRKRSDTYYFAGCLPFLGVIFREIGFEGSAIGQAAVRLLNSLGIVPAIGEAEVCCGHDAYWTGEVDRVRDLARRNVAAIRQTGARRVVFSCPECYYMFKQVYPEIVGKLGFEPVFLLTLVAERLADAKRGGLGRGTMEAKVTYQDPCRLARFDQVIAEPRALLGAIPGLELAEMTRAGRDALCCGSSSWVSCSRVNKKIQVERLTEALATGAQTLVTACPKCNIHLRCALRDQDIAGTLEITDLVLLLARSMEAAPEGSGSAKIGSETGGPGGGEAKAAKAKT